MAREPNDQSFQHPVHLTTCTVKVNCQTDWLIFEHTYHRFIKNDIKLSYFKKRKAFSEITLFLDLFF